jgi:eukaryotic-like serine/threonine-protein kinase
MGAVYRARDLQTGITAAVKVLFEREGPNAERFLQEAVMLSELSHPAIVRYLGHGVAPGGEHYLAMEWLEGRTLEDYLLGGAVPVFQAVQLAARVVDALAVAHRRGVIHRDIKPANLLLPDSRIGHAKVLDFGIARRLFDGRRITRTGATLGTPMYMSPEQARGLNEVDARSDIFSTGCVLFECLAGEPPFTGETPLAVLAKICLEQAPDVRKFRPEVPAPLAALVAGMLEKDPDKRPGDTAELARMLAELVDEIRTGVVHSTHATADYQPPAIVTPGEQRLFSVVLVQLPRKGPKRSGAGRVDQSSSSLLPAVQKATTLNPSQSPTSLKAIRGLWRKGVGTPVPDAPGGHTPGEMPAVQNAPPPDLYDDDIMTKVLQTVAPFGVEVERFYNGSLAVTRSTASNGAEQTFEMARCSLELRRLLPMAAFAVATGRADGDAAVPVGKVLERAGAMLAGAPPSVIRLDDRSFDLLGSRFETTVTPKGNDKEHRLLFEKGLREPPRTLFGKPTICVGRDRELSSLQGLYAEVVDDSVARAVIVLSPAGGGKSRVRHELLERLYSQKARFALIASRGESMRQGSSLALLSAALRSAADVSGQESPDVQRLRFAAHFGKRFDKADDKRRVVAYLGEIAGIHYPDDDFPMLRATRQDPRSMADQTRAAWLDWLEVELAVEPVVLMLEDLHWGDAASFNLVDAALRYFAGKPLLVLGFARPTLDEKFPGLWSGRNVERLSLPPLSPKSSRRLVQSVLPVATDEMADALCLRADGNPFFVEELLRATVERGEDLANTAPVSILNIIQARLDALGEGCKRVLRACSVFGMGFRRSGVAVLVGAEQLGDVEEYLDVLVKREIVFRRAAAGGREYQFRHALVREASYDTLTDRDRRVGHLLAGQFLEELGAENPAELAEHFEKAEEKPRAGHWYHLAGVRALAAVDLESALKHCERAEACELQGQELGRVKLLEGRVQYWQGKAQEACDASTVATTLLGGVEQMEAWGEVAVALGHLRGNCLQMDFEAPYLDALETLKEHPGKTQDWELWARHTLRAASFVYFLDKNEDMQAWSFLAEQGLVSDDSALVGASASFLSTMMLMQRRTRMANEHSRMATNAFEAVGNAQESAVNQLNVVSNLCDTGDYSEALSCARELMSKVDKAGLSFLKALLLANLALIYVEQDRFEEAKSAAALTTAAAGSIGSGRVAVFGLAIGARASVDLGDFASAERLLASAKQGLEESTEASAFVLATESYLQLEKGDVDLAVASARNATAALCPHSTERLFVLVCHARAERVAGNVDGYRNAAQAVRAWKVQEVVDDGVSGLSVASVGLSGTRREMARIVAELTPSL